MFGYVVSTLVNIFIRPRISINFYVYPLVSSESVCLICQFPPTQYSSHSSICHSLRFFDVSNSCSKISTLDISEKKKKQRSNIWRMWRPGYWSSLPIHRSGKVLFTKSLIKESRFRIKTTITDLTDL